MAHDVFISYSHQDKAIADAVCSFLEQRRIRCWVAPRDVPSGSEWSEGIIEAIEGTRMMVLVFSSNANNSPQVRREIERAVNKGVMIIPLRVEDIMPSRSLEYFLGNIHWLDAVTPPLEQHLDKLGQRIATLLAASAAEHEPESSKVVVSATAGRREEIPLERVASINNAIEQHRNFGYQHASELSRPLRPVKQNSDSAMHHGIEDVVFASRKSRISRFWSRGPLWVVSTLIMAAVIGVAYYFWHRQGTPQLSNPIESQLTFNSSDSPVWGQAISPDGKYIAYNDSTGLHMRVLASGEEHDLPLPKLGRPWFFTWSPDGNTLLLTFREYKGSVAISIDNLSIWRISILGGAPTKLRDHAYVSAISPDGSRIAFSSSNDHEIWLMDAQGANSQIWASDRENELTSPTWSPDGQYLAYIRGNHGGAGGSIEVRAVGAKSESVVLSDTRLEPGFWGTPSLCWISDWRLIYVLNKATKGSQTNNLWTIKLTRDGQRVGRETPLTNWSDSYAFGVNATVDGKTISMIKGHGQTDVYVGELGVGGTHLDKPRRFTLDDRGDYPDAWTRDSNTILFSSDLNGPFNIFRQNLNQQTPQRILGSSEVEASGMQFTPDGAWILYGSRRVGEAGNTVHLMRVPSSGGSPELVADLPLQDPEYFHPTNFRCPRHPNAACVLSERKDNEQTFYALDPLKGKGRQIVTVKIEDPRLYFGWALSTDGSHLAIVDQGPSIRTIDVATGTERDIAVPTYWRAQSVAWSSDDKAFFVTMWTEKGALLGRVELEGKLYPLLDRGEQWMNGVVPSPDGRYLAFGAESIQNNVWLLRKF